MSVRQAVNTLLQDQAETAPAGMKMVGAGLAAVLSAVWASFTSYLSSALAGLFLLDVILGVLKAVHQKGLDGFDWDRFWRAWVKLAAALCGVGLFTLADGLLQHGGMPEGWLPLTNVALTAMCWGFFWSALRNFAYFWPEVGDAVESAIRTRRADSKE